MRTKIVLLISVLCILGIDTFAQDTIKERRNDFSIGAELTSKYVWRGQEFCDAPVMFGTIGYNFKGLNVFTLGGYGLNGKHSEVDLGISYNYKWFTIGVSDYFFPTASGTSDNYFNFQKGQTRHSLEGYLTIAPSFVPLWLTVSTFFAGADKNLDNEQAYSSYIELGYAHSFNENNTLSLCVGAALNESSYTQYKDGFNVVNVMLKYLTYIPMGNFKLPISGTLAFNPYTNKPFCGLSIYLNSK